MLVLVLVVVFVLCVGAGVGVNFSVFAVAGVGYVAKVHSTKFPDSISTHHVQENLARIARYGVAGGGDNYKTGGQLSSVLGLQLPSSGTGISSKYGSQNIKRWDCVCSPWLVLC